MPRDPNPLKICLIAGEASGDSLGAALIAALKEQTERDIVFCGVGGPLMEAQGLHSLFPMRDLSVMGIFEVLPRLGKIMHRLNQTTALIEREKPNLVVTIDSPDFCFRVIKKLHKKGGDLPQMVHYVAPTVWAWRPERAQKLASLYDGIMCLYPFEPPYFEAENMDAALTGHPVLAQTGNGANLRRELNIGPEDKVLGLLFGSRTGELNRVGPVLREAAESYLEREQIAHIIAPTFTHLRPQVQNFLQGVPCKKHIITDQNRKWDCFAAMDCAMATSGTVGLELAVAGVPHIIAYKMNPLTYGLIKNKITVKYIHLINILLDRSAVPEFIQQGCKAEHIAQALSELDVTAQKRAFATARDMLGGNSTAPPPAQAAKYLLEKIYLRSSIGT